LRRGAGLLGFAAGDGGDNQVIRTIAALALAAGLSGCAASPFSQAPAANVAPAGGTYYQPGIPQSQYECVTDEGYGRYVPCGNKS
jgi:hypothetical protein